MLNKTKVFWVAFGVAYVALLAYGLAHEKPGAFPTLWWVIAYLALIGLWSALGAGVVLGLVVIAEHSSQIMAHAANGLRTIGNWFRS